MSWWKRLFKGKETEKPILYCVHGFGVRRTDEFLTLKSYFDALGYTIVTPLLFDQSNSEDTDAQTWLTRAEDPLKDLLAQNKKIWLLGFSMGGVIASHLASLYPVERLVLIAPAFEYITLKKILGTVEGVARQIIGKPEITQNQYPPLPDSFINTFRDIVSACKESIVKVHCPVLILHGTNDETIPVRSSDYAYESIPHDEKLMLVIKSAAHRILDEPKLNQDVLKIIHNFFNNEIVRQ